MMSFSEYTAAQEGRIGRATGAFIGGRGGLAAGGVLGHPQARAMGYPPSMHIPAGLMGAASGAKTGEVVGSKLGDRFGDWMSRKLGRTHGAYGPEPKRKRR